jgi:hypothetical protein
MADTTAKGLLNDPVPVSIRFDAGLLEKLRASAKRSLRSVNAEANYRLAASFEHKIDEVAAS